MTFDVAFCLCVVFVFLRSVHGEFTEFNVVYNVTENRQLGVYVGNIANDTDVLKNTTETVEFNFYEVNIFTQFFQINRTNGALLTSDKNIDHEKLCAFEQCQMKFEVSVVGQKFFDIVSVTVNVKDENDETPYFTNVKQTIAILENTDLGTEYDIATATDNDTDFNNTIQTYVLLPESNPFVLVATKKDKSIAFKVKLNSALDRESQSRYDLRLVVADKGKPVARTATQTFTINVLDFNDNWPVFDKAEYTVSINETIIPNTVILTLSAKDLDTGDNGKVRYQIKRQSNLDMIERLFAVDAVSGDLSVIAELKHESAEMYEFIVEASDNGVSPHVSETVVKVTVNDVENNAPTIDIKLFKTGSIDFVDVEENQQSGFFIAHVDVTDTDKGDNGMFACNITNPVFSLEKFQNRGFKVIATGTLDRETVPMHNVTVLCHDFGTPQKFSSRTIFVRVTDVNDNTPDFYGNTVYAVSKNENMKNEIVTRVIARDLDAGLNGTIEYVLENPNSDFAIDSSTGVITMKTDLDREEAGIRVFRVLAVDKGFPRRTGTCTVSLTLVDVNDNPPVIIPTRPEFTFLENQPANSTVGQLNAEDLDIGINAKVSFKMAPLETPVPFVMTSTGVIYATRPLDREQQSRYDIPVTVTDQGVPALSSTQSVTIYVADVNDNAPQVTFPNDTNNTVTFPYKMDGYSVVTTIAAYDTDFGDNGTLVYTILSGNDDNIFQIDSTLGEINVVNYIDIKEDTTYTLSVQVSDKGEIPLSSTVTLKVTLLYTNGMGAKAVQSDTSNKYIIISVVVIVTTVAVAVAIIGFILFLRSTDRRKNHEDLSARYSDSGISSASDSHPPETEVQGSEDGQGNKKKKEVSFSLEYSLNSLEGGRTGESSTDDYLQNVSRSTKLYIY